MLGDIRPRYNTCPEEVSKGYIRADSRLVNAVLNSLPICFVLTIDPA